MPATRACAAQLIARLLYGSGSLPAVLYEAADSPGVDQALLWQLCYGTARWFPQLHALRRLLLAHPLPKRDREVSTLLLVGLYQLLHTRISHHAAVHTTVEACYVLRKERLSRLVNGVLRNYLRQHDQLLRRLSPAERAALPDWLWDSLRQAWPELYPAIAASSTQQPPMTLRVNSRRGARAAFLGLLEEQGIAGTPCRDAEYGIRLEKPVMQESVPGFSEGLVSVQDEAAQLAAPLLEVPPGSRVLDACAAPGGKSGHLLEHYPEMAQLICLERDKERLETLRRNLSRLHLLAADASGAGVGAQESGAEALSSGPPIQLQQADARRLRDWWDGTPFARILLDVPCSGSGVLSRHPDIKILRRAEDILSFTSTQAALLDALWNCLEPEGILLYVSCSLLPEENEQQIASFLYRHRDARELPLEASWGTARLHGRQLLPHENNGDGLYYARLYKTGGVESPT